jgi:hypothetical protein
MLTPAVLVSILKIVELSLELANKIHDDMTPEQRQAHWERHEKRIEFMERLFAFASKGN